jgi:hypothetical protein
MLCALRFICRCFVLCLSICALSVHGVYGASLLAMSIYRPFFVLTCLLIVTLGSHIHIPLVKVVSRSPLLHIALYKGWATVPPPESQRQRLPLREQRERRDHVANVAEANPNQGEGAASVVITVRGLLV